MTHLTNESALRQLRVGTRGSALARAQTDLVISRLRAAVPGHDYVREIIRTEGDADKTSPLSQIGGRGVFTSALQDRLLDGTIDLAVHAAKDVPSLSPPGLVLAAFPDREDPRDALITRHGVSLADLPANPVIGTSSRRRAVQLLALRPDAEIRELRGNIDTRLARARTDAFDAIILAVAGITRMGWAEAITEALPIETFTPAPAQGAIGVETRDEPTLREIVGAIDLAAVNGAVAIERAFLRGVGGGCTSPIGAHARPEDDGFALYAMFSDDSGARLSRERLTDATAETAFDLARRMQRDVQQVFPTGGAARPLVLTTGSASQQDGLAAALDALGMEILHLPTFRIEPPDSLPDTAGLAVADWVVVTSANALPHTGHLIRAQIEGGARLAVVGERTRQAAEAAGLPVTLAGTTDGASLAQDLITQDVAGQSILCLLSDKAAATVPGQLRDAGADVHVITAYRNLPVDEFPASVADAMRSCAIAAVTFASPSAVEGFVMLAREHLPALSSASFVAIGETTAAALREHGLPVHDIAATPDPVGLADAVVRTVGIARTSR